MEQNFIITKIYNVIYVGKQEYPEPYTKFGSDLSRQELIYHCAGEDATVYFGDQVLKTSSETIRYLPKGKVSRYELARTGWGDCFVIYFDTDIPVDTKAFVQKATNNRKIAELFQKIFTVWIRKDDNYRMEAFALLYKIFAELQRQNYLPEQQYQRIAPAVDHVHTHFLDEKLNCEQLAALCAISPTYFKRLFTKRFHLPPGQYILRLKIHCACDLLQQEQFSVGQVALLSGFENVYYFSRVFKSQMHLTPTEFRQKYRSSK